MPITISTHTTTLPSTLQTSQSPETYSFRLQQHMSNHKKRLSTLRDQLESGSASSASNATESAVASTHKKLYITAPREVAWVEEPMPACPTDGVVVKTTTTCMSVGTELRCYRGIPVDPVDIGGEGKYLHVSARQEFDSALAPCKHPPRPLMH